ncbi:putative neutral sphingomyelinase [Anoplophora glabripennis]|nr:putative neutral sphingomyelinase [Anoplophora glabripennis]
MDFELELKIFTLNCWGLAVVSKNRKERIQAIAEVLATSQYDVVCLQEVWTDRDYNLIRKKVSGVLPFSHYFYSGVTGSGVCILSRHPIEETFFHQWSVNGYIHKLHHGDWFGGKGVGLCKLKINNFNINVYSAHLHAEYDRESDEYQAHRILQAYDTAQFIMLTSGGADLVILAGDLNTEPGDLAYRVTLCVPGLLDAFTEANEVPNDKVATNESLQNSYTPSSLVRKNIPGKRIDYIMYHPGSKIHVDLKKYNLPLPDRVPERSFSYSDHEAIEATLVINRKEIPDRIRDLEQKKIVLEDSLVVLEDALRRLNTHQLIYLIFSLVLFITLLVSAVLDSPVGYAILFYVLRALITVLMVFTIIMATIWNKIERHAVLAGKLAIEVTLKKYNVSGNL